MNAIAGLVPDISNFVRPYMERQKSRPEPSRSRVASAGADYLEGLGWTILGLRFEEWMEGNRKATNWHPDFQKRIEQELVAPSPVQVNYLVVANAFDKEVWDFFGGRCESSVAEFEESWGLERVRFLVTKESPSDLAKFLIEKRDLNKMISHWYQALSHRR